MMSTIGVTESSGPKSAPVRERMKPTVNAWRPLGEAVTAVASSGYREPSQRDRQCP